MGEKKVMMMTCDRCGSRTFRDFVETRDTDGGYTKYDVYKERPEGWAMVCDKFVKGLLCPTCLGIYRDRMAGFMPDPVEQEGD